jgi:hypothetical protein
MARFLNGYSNIAIKIMDYRLSKAPFVIGGILILLLIAVILFASFNQGAIIVTDQPLATPTPQASEAPQATSTEPTPTPIVDTEYTTWEDTIRGYTIDFLSSMTNKEGGSETIFTFPASMTEGGTYREAAVTIANTLTECSISTDGINTTNVIDTKTINGVEFEHRKYDGAAAGNRYLSDEYSTMRNGECFRIALFTHTISTGATTGSEVGAAALDTKNKEIAKALETVFQKMLTTLTFTE